MLPQKHPLAHWVASMQLCALQDGLLMVKKSEVRAWTVTGLTMPELE